MSEATSETTSERYDIAIIGGGPAGMSAALVAGRARMKTIVFNAEAPRNAVAHASHGFLTRDGVHASELLSIAKTQLLPYPSVSYRASVVEGVIEEKTDFILTSADGQTVRARRVVIATGYRDDPSRVGIPGFEEVYGKSVFPCPFCDGFEHRDEQLALFGYEGVERFVPLLRVWSEDVVVFTHGRALGDEAYEALTSHQVSVYQERIARLHANEEGVLTHVELEGGARIARQSGFVHEDISAPSTTFAQDLGVSVKENDWGMEVLDADDFGKTEIERLYVIGDARVGFGGLIGAASEGSRCMAHIVHEIAAERW